MPFHLLDSSNAGVEALIVLISHADQIEDIFFSSEGVYKGIIKLLLQNHFLAFLLNLNNRFLCFCISRVA